MNYKIIKKIISHNNPGTAFLARGAVIHETANPNDSAMSEWSHFNSANRDASAHIFVDPYTIIQCIDWSCVAWHAGRTANSKFWGIEMCHTDDPDLFNEVWKRTVWLFAHLYVDVAFPRILKVNKINTMSHAEVSREWGETDHQDPESYFANFGKTVNMFRADVQKEIDLMLFNKTLMCKGLISTPEYWQQNAVAGGVVDGEYMNAVIIRFVAMFAHVDTFKEAVCYLWQNGIIGTHEYWNTNAVKGGKVKGDYARIVLIGMGGKL